MSMSMSMSPFLPPLDHGSGDWPTGSIASGNERSRTRWRRTLSGKRCLVTGASSGVGRAVAVELSRRGAHVLATARREPLLLGLAAEQIGIGMSPPILYVAGDITSDLFRQQLIQAAIEQMGGLDILVAAAGSGAIGAFSHASPQTLKHIMDVDFFAPAELLRQSLPTLACGHDSVAVFVGSILGYHALPLHAEYCAAKSALRSLANTLRLEIAPAGIQILLASLGPTETEFWDHLLTGTRPSWSRGPQWSAKQTANSIVTAIEHRRREIVPGFRAKAFVLGSQLFPGLINAILKRRFQRDAGALHNQPR